MIQSGNNAIFYRNNTIPFYKTTRKSQQLVQRQYGGFENIFIASTTEFTCYKAKALTYEDVTNDCECISMYIRMCMCISSIGLGLVEKSVVIFIYIIHCRIFKAIINTFRWICFALLTTNCPSF